MRIYYERNGDVSRPCGPDRSGGPNEEVRPTQMSRLAAKVLMPPLLAFLILFALAGGAGAQAENISIDGYELTYSGDMTEGVGWNPLEDTPEADAVFFIRPGNGTELTLFTMTLEDDQGDYVVILTAPEGDTVPVSFEMAEKPPGLTDDEKWAFTWAQADVYVLIQTLALTAVPADVQEDPFRLVTDAYELSYGARWRGQVSVVPERDGSVTFLAVVGKRCLPMFTLVYGDGGDYAFVVTGEGGRCAVLSFYISSAPPGLDDTERKIFCAAQSLLNEVADSIVLR